jgi:tripartite-type tricarboxylate transporter receptor subunit TctC
VNALVAGEVQLMFATVASVLPHMKSGRVRALAITTAHPSALAPGLPTVASAGLPGFEMGGAGNGIFVPAKTPAALIRRLNSDIVRVLAKPEVKDRLFLQGIEAVGSSPEEYAAAIKADSARAEKIIRFAGIGGS